MYFSFLLVCTSYDHNVVLLVIGMYFLSSQCCTSRHDRQFWSEICEQLCTSTVFLYFFFLLFFTSCHPIVVLPVMIDISSCKIMRGRVYSTRYLKYDFVLPSVTNVVLHFIAKVWFPSWLSFFMQNNEGPSVLT
jgi:hypothetical protein